MLIAIKAKNRAALNSEATPDYRPQCASRTWHADGKKILNAIRAQQAAALDRALSDNHKNRSDDYVRKEYAAQILAKRNRLAESSQ